jgi:hypothetical protein
MTQLNQPLTLDEYRAQVVMQLKACAEAARAAELLSDVETMLAATQTSPSLQSAFWRAFSQDLDLLAQRATLLDPGAAATLRVVISTARAAATHALRRLPGPDPAAD